jgi:hypothetical protein
LSILQKNTLRWRFVWKSLQGNEKEKLNYNVVAIEALACIIHDTLMTFLKCPRLRQRGHLNQSWMQAASSEDV